MPPAGFPGWRFFWQSVVLTLDGLPWSIAGSHQVSRIRITPPQPMNTRIGFAHAFGRKAGALLLCSALTVPSLAQTVQSSAPAANPASATKVPVVESTSKPTDETLVLSPFEVKADTRGYFSSNTMSGTRFNTRLEDLGS